MTGGVLADARVDFLFDGRRSASRYAPYGLEVETQPFRRNHRSRLMDVAAENVAQSVMQDMGCGMVEHRGVAPLAIDFRLTRCPLLDPASATRKLRPT